MMYFNKKFLLLTLFIILSALQYSHAESIIKSSYLSQAEQGNIEAQYRVGAENTFNSKTVKESREWLEKAATKGHVEAQYALGLNYGWSNPLDTEKAKYWLAKAMEQDHAQAESALQFIDILPPKSGKKFISQDERNKKIEEFKLAAASGTPESQFILGKAYLYGWQQSFEEKAREWFEKAAIQGHSESQYMLGMSFGYQNPIELDKAKFWLEKAASQGHTRAKVYLEYIKSLQTAS